MAIPTDKVQLERIDCENLVLLPYSKDLVPTYHSWMCNPELLALTCSEPLSLEAEYANQISWEHDPTKYCWIIHSRRPVISSFREGPGIQTGIGVDYTLASAAQAEELKRPVPELEGEGELAEDDEDDDSLNLAPEQIEAEAAEAREALADAAARLDLAGGEAGERIRTTGSRRSSNGGASESDNAAASSSAAASPSTGDIALATASPSIASLGAAASAASSSSSSSSAAASSSAASSASAPRPAPYLDRYPLTPIGDLNLFLHDDFNLADYGIAGGGAEIEIMIALERYRKRGLGHEALVALMHFARESLGIERFVVKILRENLSSIALFEQKLGFHMVEYVEVFDEMVFFKDTSEGRGFGGAQTIDCGEEGEQPDEDEEEVQARVEAAQQSTNAAEATKQPELQTQSQQQQPPSSSSMPSV